ncbi:hypothetical protein BDZ97DRAFT_811241 [Flammula alnicola]|nr:hypothetical protein BDZ97DRAFT_811241 [Flammula alnicola]
MMLSSDMDPVLAMDIALGDADPISHLPMKDINPGFVPRALKPLPTVSNSPVKSLKGKGKMRESLPPGGKTREQNPPTGGILSFFGPNPIIPPRSKQKKPVSTAVAKHGLTGKASGKRTLAEVMDQDMERKKKSRKSCSPLPFTRSKFFAPPEAKATGVQRRHSDGVAGPSRLQDDNKENMYVVVDDDDDPAETSEPDLDGSDLSLRAHFDVDAEMNLDLEEFPDAVEQEDGYISASPSYSKDAQELSSPLQPGQSSRSRRRQWNDSGTREDDEMGQTEGLPSDKEEEENSFGGAEAVSSPISVKRPKPFGRRNAYQTPPRWSRNEDSGGDILVVPTPTPTNRKGIYPDVDEVPSPTLYRGPDLRNLLGADSATEIEFEVLELEEKPFTARGGSASGSGCSNRSSISMSTTLTG